MITEDGMNFGTAFLQHWKNEDIRSNDIICSDERQISINGMMNKQNWRFWGLEKPREHEEASLLSLKFESTVPIFGPGNGSLTLTHLVVLLVVVVVVVVVVLGLTLFEKSLRLLHFLLKFLQISSHNPL